MMKSTEFVLDEIQNKVDKMASGDRATIVDGAYSGIPILQLHSILQGSKFHIREKSYISAIADLRVSEDCIFGISISECAIAACDALGSIPYQGNDERIIGIIREMKEGTLI